MSAACVILAAGASTRLGEPKQLLRFSGETLLDRAVRVALECGCAPVVVVLGASAEAILSSCGLHGAEVVHNPDWADGMGGSLRVGVQALNGRVSEVIAMTCDQPAVTAEHLRALAERCRQESKPVASFYGGSRGVPACFPSRMFPELMALEGDHGARALLATASTVELVDGNLDVDTPESLERARRVYGDS